MTSGLVARALVFAAEAHAKAKPRRYTNEPYIVHPIEVLDIFLASADAIFQSDENHAAILLHDTVEDTKTTLSDIEDHFGDKVAVRVDGLTEKATLEMGNRLHRKQLEVERLAAEGADVQTIKYADLISNLRSILQHDEGFARVFAKEMRALLIALDKGCANLRSKAFIELINAEAILAGRRPESNRAAQA